MTPLLTNTDRMLMLANGAASDVNEEHDPFPVVRIYIPATGCVWLLSDLDPQHPDCAFGPTDLSMGFPELGTVSLAEMAAIRLTGGPVVQRDPTFKADRALVSVRSRHR